MSSTATVLKEILARIKFDPTLFDRHAEGAHLVDDVGLDSIEMMRFMLEIEATLSVKIDFNQLDYSHLRSVDTLAAFLDTMPSRLP
jgi:acyl carrier protein